MLDKFRVGHLNTVVLIQNVLSCADADCDADRTVQEIVLGLDQHRGFLARSLLESGLYCCNLNNEAGQFVHPLGRNFTQFLNDTLASDLEFDRFYNIIKSRPV